MPTSREDLLGPRWLSDGAGGWGGDWAGELECLGAAGPAGDQALAAAVLSTAAKPTAKSAELAAPAAGPPPGAARPARLAVAAAVAVVLAVVGVCAATGGRR